MTSHLAPSRTPAKHTTETLPHGELIASWLASLSSENTRRAYRRDLASFLSWLSVSKLDLLEVRRVHADTWRSTLEGAASTRARKLSAVSSFYAYALTEDAVPGNPVAVVRRPRVNLHDSTTQGLSESEARALLAAAQNDTPRSYALVYLVLTTGIRISEVLEARRSAIKHVPGAVVLEIVRKGGKRGRVTVTPGVARALENYLSEPIRSATPARRGDRQDPWLFTTATGHQWAQSEAYRTVRRLADKAGIPGRISPHSLRHAYATIALDNGAALRDVQDFMGHADPRTTRRYDRSRNRLERDPALTLSRVFGA
ncbi:tyrosine-type recombinase/integrase [Kocuria sp. CPCC 205292]|uniref:tyrosine-type recombinase/integrase n=1 Tax=Kocuria cellulosilytica TaxID=3071451 RepID=UPI0034D3BCFD